MTNKRMLCQTAARQIEKALFQLELESGLVVTEIEMKVTGSSSGESVRYISIKTVEKQTSKDININWEPE